MACFLVPAAEAVITTVATEVVKSNEKKEAGDATLSTNESARLSLSTKLGWLNKLLWGGSALLAFEHLWHGEIEPFFPFLTAVKDGSAADMLAEMGTVGVSMSVCVTAAWAGMLAISSAIVKRKPSGEAEKA